MAKIMVAISGISVPMYFINAQNQLTVLSIVNNPDAFTASTAEQYKRRFYFTSVSIMMA